MNPPGKHGEPLVGENGRDQSPVDHALRIFQESPYLAIRQIECSYEDGVLTISGSVPSYYLKQLAQAAVLDLQGVDRLSNCLNVTH